MPSHESTSNSVGADAVGIEAFLGAARAHVAAVLKHEPQDFIVREISADGDVVTLSDGDDTRVPSADERAAVLQRKREEQSGKAAQKGERLEFAEPDGGWFAGLCAAVGELKAREVERVAREQLDECTLEAPAEFRDRVFVQVCAQNYFAGLDCKLLKHTEPERAQIRVALDPVYKKYRADGMAADNCAKLLGFLRQGAGHPAAARGIELTHEDSKEARTLLHRVISKHSACFRTRTELRGGVQRLVVSFSDRANKKKRKRTEPEVFLQFVLEKTNVEHFACFEALARDLKRPLAAFSYAGVKDKVAVTSQHVVVQGVEPAAALLALNSTASGIRVGDLAFVGAPMALGSAGGNRFTIALREVSCEGDDAPADPHSVLAEGFETLAQRGFINYFGFQRVGHPAHRIRQHHIGQQIAAGNWKAAVMLLLTPAEREPEAVAAAKRAFVESGDVDAALKALPAHLSLERSVLQGLKRFGPDAFDRALESVSYARRLLFVHAYQSFVFNTMASARLRLFGSAALVEGDLVRDAATGVVAAISSAQAAQLNERHAQPLELAVLPLAGTNVTYPTNAVGDEYMKLLEGHGTKAFLTETGTVRGSYRSLLARPTALEWRFEPATRVLHASFSLPSGSFATMCLREVLQHDL
ncbi:hypothetical protein PybrP1_003315 [[Pythium] brassicae (nom. inval.)]|nr:hypothetical protein PybrP1_003315 [[Pythium] brassicae (nom. inval.)]